MIELGFLPLAGVMAGLTLDAVLAFMHIIIFVAGNAGEF